MARDLLRQQACLLPRGCVRACLHSTLALSALLLLQGLHSCLPHGPEAYAPGLAPHSHLLAAWPGFVGSLARFCTEADPRCCLNDGTLIWLYLCQDPCTGEAGRSSPARC